MIELVGPKAELRFTLTIKRAATGLEETVEMVGYVNPEEMEAFIEEQRNVGNPQHSS
jgi:hypothetical protein